MCFACCSNRLSTARRFFRPRAEATGATNDKVPDRKFRAFADYDRDGHLDLFVANYLDFTLPANRGCFDSVGARDYCSPRAYRPAPITCTGPGQQAVRERDRIRRHQQGRRRRPGVAAGDYNGDGWRDFYVANDATPNQLWINQRDGRTRAPSPAPR